MGCRTTGPQTLGPCAGFGQPDPRKGHVVVQLRTSSAVDLLRYACSPRIIPMSTNQINSSRCAATPGKYLKVKPAAQATL